MFRKWMLVITVLGVSACGPAKYVAEEYPVENERVGSFDVKGEVTVNNRYSAPKPVKVRALDADLQQITQVFADQLEKEIEQNGNKIAGGSKTIDAKVLRVDYANRFVYNEGTLEVELKLGNGDTVTFTKKNGTPGNYFRAMNGAVAKAVIEALEHDKVKAYLAQ